VYVVGTHFDVAWDEERFELVLHEGAVRVVGPTLPQGRVISAGERLDITLGLVPSVLSLPPAPALQQLAVPAPTVSSLAQAPAPPALAPTATNWRKFALAGAHDRAWSLLTNESFAGLVRGAGPADLALAADVARFTRHPAEAARALEALRMRFPSYAQASDAAFLLGRLSFDQRSAVAEAARWFSTYVAERPNGAFAREARGRLIECYERLTALPQARSAAEDYLARYPAGPHEAIARAVLAKTNPDRGESN
jgi:hypothetical protein